MDIFPSLFGRKPSEIKESCILVPFITPDLLKDFGLTEMRKGKLYSTGNTEALTLIHTHIGAPFVGDAVLYLKETACQNVVLFGSCGLVRETPELTLGSVVAVEKSYNMESFSRLLLSRADEPKFSCGDQGLLKVLLGQAQVSVVTAATVGSLKLEPDLQKSFEDKKVDVVDMECSAFFEAARFIQRKALALFYVTDIIGQKPFFLTFAAKEQQIIREAQKRGSKILRTFTQQLT